jgi:UDP-N-acetylmuramate dehydrogenase
VPFDPPEEGVPLAPLSTLGVGGAARWFARATSISDVIAAHGWAAARGASLFVLGGGSNLVIADEGFDGLVLQVALRGVKVAVEGEDTIVSAGAGELWDPLVDFTVSRGLAGLECLSGIPGTVGGTPIQNVGAYGQEVASSIESVTAFDRREQRTVMLSASECGFAYRMSRFKQHDAGRFVVCEVAFRLRPGAGTATYPDLVEYLSRDGVASSGVRDVREAVLAVRRRKGMVIDVTDPDTRSVGSFFMNPVVDGATFERIAASGGRLEGSAPYSDGRVRVSGADPLGWRIPHFAMENGEVKIPAAWLIERSGFGRGQIDGAVGLSSKHPLAIVNRAGATARNIVRFARRIKTAVRDRFGINLRPEPVFIGFDADDPDVASLTS